MRADYVVRRAGKRLARRTDRDLSRYFRVRPYFREVVPDDVEQLDENELLPPAAAFGRGVDLHEADQLALLESWTNRFDALFAAIRRDRQINPEGAPATCVQNAWYETPDAEVYAAMIADRKPSRIIEIGAGYSTRIARRAIALCSAETELVVVDPEPRADVSGYADKVLRQRVEEIDPADFALDERALLFVDSSHIVRAGGDVPTIFCRLVPELPAGVLVHVHDVLLPYDYPAVYRLRLYTEAYVLWALLARASAFRTVLATHFMSRTHVAKMREAFGRAVGSDDRHFGTSFWFEVT